MTRPIVPWFVDLQRGFADPPALLPPAEGGLYVHDLGDPTDPGAVLIRPRVAALRDWAERHGTVLVYQGDVHRWGDREIVREHPDPANGTYLMHCEEGTPAAELIPEVKPRRALLVLSRDAQPGEGARVAREVVAARGAVFIEKREFGVFLGNPEAHAFADELHRLLGDPVYVGSGIATDVCVRQWIEPMLGIGRDVVLVRDAIHGLGLTPDEELVQRWTVAGAKLANVGDLERLAGSLTQETRGQR
jgi:nicotinamidase-related amidase